MPYEPTVKKNPRQLIKNQHVHTAHAIEFFCDSDGKVEIQRLNCKKSFRVRARDQIFCARRAWDQKAETGFMYRIERDFHEEIDHVKGYLDRNHEAVSAYCCLWRLRHECHLRDPEDMVLNGMPGSELTKEEEEVAEKKGVAFVRHNGAVPSRFSTSMQIKRGLDICIDSCSDFKWGLIEAMDGEFLVADGYGDLGFIPISPKLAFLLGEVDKKINREVVAELNGETVSRAKRYYFARNLNDCPVP